MMFSASFFGVVLKVTEFKGFADDRASFFLTYKGHTKYYC